MFTLFHHPFCPHSRFIRLIAGEYGLDLKLVEERSWERREAFLLRHLTVYRNTDNWLNAVTEKENAYAATNYPFNVVTLYPDFFTKAADDTERAMILLHEAQHLQGTGEREAYAYAWESRRQVGWTLLEYGATEGYVTVETLTRETAPELFTCADRLWNDCTENPKPANGK